MTYVKNWMKVNHCTDVEINNRHPLLPILGKPSFLCHVMTDDTPAIGNLHLRIIAIAPWQMFGQKRVYIRIDCGCGVLVSVFFSIDPRGP